MTVTSREVRVVNGTPAYAGTAVTELTPGTISKSTPAFAHAAASSAPVAYIHGSPDEEPDDVAAGLGVLDDELGTRRHG